MEHRIPSVFFATVLFVIVILVTSLAGTASAEDEAWKARFSVVWMNPNSGEVYVPEEDERYTYQGNNGYGFGIDFEYRASRRLGINFGVISASPGIDVTIGEEPLTLSADADIRITPIYASANFYLTPESTFELYIGPLLAYVIYENFELVASPGMSEWFTTDNGFGIGAVVGLDIALGERWLLNTAVRYLDTRLEATQDGGVGKADLNPTIFSIGFGVKF